ncbi:MAG: hypothetical protein J07HQX50_01517, partial [Haloquadratum sp. J07HQX50]
IKIASVHSILIGAVVLFSLGEQLITAQSLVCRISTSAQHAVQANYHHETHVRIGYGIEQPVSPI